MRPAFADMSTLFVQARRAWYDRRVVRKRLCLAIALSGLSHSACQRGEAPTPIAAPAGATTIVARVGETSLSVQDIAAEARRRHVSPREALDERIRFELLARAARSSLPGEVAPTAAQAEELNQARVERLIAEEVEPLLRRDAVPEPEIRGAYERVKKRFVHGRQVEIGVLCVFTGARMRTEARERAHQNALALREWVRAHPGSANDWEALSHEPTWTARNVTFTKVWQDQSEPFPAVVGAAAQALSSPGQTSNLVGDETGDYLVRYVSERPAEDVPFERARPTLLSEIFEPWRRQKFIKLSIEMAKDHLVEVFPENFYQLRQE